MKERGQYWLGEGGRVRLLRFGGGDIPGGQYFGEKGAIFRSEIVPRMVGDNIPRKRTIFQKDAVSGGDNIPGMMQYSS